MEEITCPCPSSTTCVLDMLIGIAEETEKKRVGKRLTRKRLKEEKKETGYDTETVERLLNIKEELVQLRDMVGLDGVKESVAEHVLYMAQNLSTEYDMNHVQICGEPGSGKSTLADILGRIYAGLGILEYGNVIKVTRGDLIGGYLGSTTLKTEEVLESCIGNVLLIDEAYSLGCEDRKDSFAKECIDCITQFLSEHRSDTLCIIAGYEREIKECFFSVNRGLERRFPWKFVLGSYGPGQLREMFVRQLKREEWTLGTDEDTCSLLAEIFCQANSKYFSNYGGDTESFFVRCKMAHSRRVFCDRTTVHKTLTTSDVREGYEKFVQVKKRSEISSSAARCAHMYC